MKRLSESSRAERGQSGVTLIELMVALVVTSFAVAAGLSLAYSMMNGYRDHQRSIAVERAARTATDYIANAVRGSSPGVSSGEIVNLTGVACGTNIPALAVVNSSSASDELYVFHASGGVFTSVANGSTYDCSSGCPNTINVVSADEFTVGDTVVITGDHTEDPLGVNNDHTGEFHIGYALQVVGKDDIADTLTVSTACAIGSASAAETVRFETGALVVRSRYSRFYVDTANYADPTLVLEANVAGSIVTEPLAEGIEDFQVSVAIDSDNNGTIFEDGQAVNDDEIFGNVSGETGPTAVGLGNAAWRGLRTTIVARSTGEIQTTGVSARPDAEDHAGDSTNTPYKRRTLTTVIELRNMEGSP